MNEEFRKRECSENALCHDFNLNQLWNRHSGFDRGHLAAAGNHRASLEDCQETFYYSNMAPQVGEGFNRGAWNSLEKMVSPAILMLALCC